jgi:hypothetical protein
MPIDLRARAQTQLQHFETLTTTIRDRLAHAHDDLERAHDDPASVAQSDWHVVFGGAQHLQIARTKLAANRAAQLALRKSLASVATPAEAGPQGAALRELLIAEGMVGIEVRAGEERVAGAASLIESHGALVSRSVASISAATARLAWASDHQALGDRLRTEILAPPLDTIVADATAVLGGAEFTAADTRLDVLLPAELRARATARFGEAQDGVGEIGRHLATVDDVIDSQAGGAHPIDAAIDIAHADLTLAERDAEIYVSRSTGRLAAALASLVRVAAHGAVTAAQAAALDATGRTDAIAAVGKEADLAAAVHAVDAAQRDVDDAIALALDNDPDADPETDPAVIAARDALAAPAFQDALDDARSAYDDASRRALDEWEIEVPPSVWVALREFVDAERTLSELGDQLARVAVVDALDAANDALAAALDISDGAERSEIQMLRQRGERRAELIAAEQTTPSRLIQYTRGDGPSGRTAFEI